MSRLKFTGILAILVVLAGVTSLAAADVNSDVGTKAFPFLKINVGARPVSLGGAFTGLADDESALYYNPAGIVTLEGSNYILDYHNYFVDMQSGMLGGIKRIGENKALAMYISYLNYGSMIETNLSGDVLGEFNGGDWLFGVTYAMSHTERYQFGASAKFIYEKVHDYSATGVALDLGARYASDRGRYTAGFAVQNLGVQLSSLGEEDKDGLPLTFRLGVAARPRGIKLLFAADLIKPIDNDLDFAVGTEYFELKPLLLRLGWNSFGSNYRAEDSDDKWAGLALGLGIDIKDLGFIKNAQLSYSYSPAADLGESHRITLTGGR